MWHDPHACIQRQCARARDERGVREGEDILFRALPLSRRDVAAAKSTATPTLTRSLSLSSVRSLLVLFCNKSMNEWGYICSPLHSDLFSSLMVFWNLYRSLSLAASSKIPYSSPNMFRNAWAFSLKIMHTCVHEVPKLKWTLIIEFGFDKTDLQESPVLQYFLRPT